MDTTVEQHEQVAARHLTRTERLLMVIGSVLFVIFFALVIASSPTTAGAASAGGGSGAVIVASAPVTFTGNLAPRVNGDDVVATGFNWTAAYAGLMLASMGMAFAPRISRAIRSMAR
jgi:hypothetical protein